jgi:hypothetical protein
MDTGRGFFEMMKKSEDDAQAQEMLRAMRAEHPQHGGTFYVGQNLQFEGSKFRVLAITKKTMTLRLLPASAPGVGDKA